MLSNDRNSMNPIVSKFLDKHRWELWAAAHEGLCASETARRIGASHQTVISNGLRLGIRFRPKKLPGQPARRQPVMPRKPELIKRDLEIIALRETGLTYKEIASNFGITGERVRQLLKNQCPELCGRQSAAHG